MVPVPFSPSGHESGSRPGGGGFLRECATLAFLHGPAARATVKFSLGPLRARRYQEFMPYRHFLHA